MILKLLSVRLFILFFVAAVVLMFSDAGAWDSEAEKVYTIAEGGLFLRDKPSGSGKIIVKIPADSEVSIIKYGQAAEKIDNINERWVNIKYKNFTGWVFGGYLVIKASDGTNSIYFDGGVIEQKSLFYKRDLKAGSEKPLCYKEFKEIEQSGAFEAIHKYNISQKSFSDAEYFIKNSHYKIIKFVAADIFGTDDFVYIVYDARYTKITIIIYDSQKKKYFHLYDDIKVVNTERDSKGNYYSDTSLDYEFGSVIADSSEYIIKNPVNFIKDYNVLKFVNIKQDNNFILSVGGFSTGINSNNLLDFKSICISTSICYNNWRCLKYDKQRNLFIDYYYQAFAD